MSKPQGRGAAASATQSITPSAGAAVARSKPSAKVVSDNPSRSQGSAASKVRKPQLTPLKAQPVAKTTRLPTPMLDAEDSEMGLAPNAGSTAPADMTARAFREDPGLDRHIIEGMLQDKDAFLSSMQTQGYSREAVLRRAAELGLSEALIRQVMGVAADLAGERPGRRRAPASLGARKCLQCDRVFLSSGPGNRLCMRCRGGDAGLAQL